MPLQVVIEAVVASLDMLGMLVFLLLLLLVLCSSILYFTEVEVHGTAFDSIPASLWWCQVTLLTVSSVSRRCNEQSFFLAYSQWPSHAAHGE